MGQIRRVALVAMALTVMGSAAFAGEAKPAAEPVKTSTTDRLKAKKKAPAASLDKKTVAAPAKPAAPRQPAAAAPRHTAKVGS
ncbi:hypothetical protein [Roseiterribacter gracilis]|uniref:Uncharacterized protein n=1 Tax=Roseiterribacter gracilis TaxID=2812848 RepID=A0A8S8XEX0_9PROT|nr:hypothetical protein TMPK1_41500 [Rhodospirillales bacterium TMPK1]